MHISRVRIRALTLLRGGVQVGDFGLAKLFPHEGLRQSTSTYVGTPGYAPPEILSHEMYSFNADVWTLGICVYIILCGCPPFPQDMRASTVAKIKNADKELRFPAQYFKNCSEECKVMLATRPRIVQLCGRT